MLFRSLIVLWLVSFAATNILAAPQPPIIGLGNDPQVFQRTELSPTVYLAEVSGVTRAHLTRVDELLASGQWDEAIEALMQVSDEDADGLIPASGDKDEFPVYVRLRRFVNGRLCGLPTAAQPALQSYRRRVDALARRWYEQAVSERDSELLRRIVDEMLASTHGDNALFALGEMALERRQHLASRRYWERLRAGLRWTTGRQSLPLWFAFRGADVDEISPQVLSGLVTTRRTMDAYPDSEFEWADVWARLVLVSILEGDRPRARFEIDLLRQLAPDTRGKLAGREVSYVAALDALLAQSEHWPPADAARDWPTFAGNFSRNRRAPEPIDIALRPIWTTSLEVAPRTDESAMRQFRLPAAHVAEQVGHLCSHHPIVVGDLVLLRDEGRIRCLKLYNGRPAWEGPAEGVIYAPSSLPVLSSHRFALRQLGMVKPQLGTPRFTLSVCDSLLLARMGSAAANDRTGSVRSQLIGFDLSAEAANQFGPLQDKEGEWSFHGAPVSDGALCWVGMRRSDVTPQEHVACFDAKSGQMIWRQRICSAETLSHGEATEITNNLLTYHEGILYYNTNLGAVAALSAQDGRVEWITLYPRTGAKRANLLDEPWHLLRDLTPCLLHRGLVVVAPADCRQVFALDATTGQVVWKTDIAGDAVHLLGVTDDDQLILSGHQLWWLDIYTGDPSKSVKENPFPSGNRAWPRGFGRGVLAGDYVYWPTHGEPTRGELTNGEPVGREIAEIYVLHQRSGQQVRQPINLWAAGADAGNLVIARGHLLVASPQRLFVFNETGRVEKQE